MRRDRFSVTRGGWESEGGVVNVAVTTAISPQYRRYTEETRNGSMYQSNGVVFGGGVIGRS